MLDAKPGYVTWVRERHRVVEIQYMPDEKNTEGTVHYDYYINYNGRMILLPNRTDFNCDEEGLILELYEQRTQETKHAHVDTSA
jgi:hypothetical protein